MILVIGGSGRIGFDVVQRLSETQEVLVIDVQASADLSWLAKQRASVTVVELDVTSELFLEKLLFAIGPTRKIEGLVYSAYPRPINWSSYEASADSLGEDLHNHLSIPLQIVSGLFRRKRFANPSSVVLLGSVQSLGAPKFDHYQGIEMFSPLQYSVAKWGLNGGVKWMAKYFGSSEIRVNMVSPGGISAGQPTTFTERYRESTLTKGLLEPRDVSGAILFLLGADSKFITGQNLVVDDGWSL